MKSISVLLLFSVVGLCSCHDQALEKRVTLLEAQVKILEDIQKEKADASVEKELEFKGCITRASADYQESIENNGTKNKNGTFAVDIRVQQQIERQKQSKFEECKLLYK